MYLFFVRHFNDIDHITPVIWRMAQDNYPVAVYCLNPKYDIQGDYRLNFLKKCGVQVDYIYNEGRQNFGLMHRMIQFLFFLSFAAKRQLEKSSRSPFSYFKRMIAKQSQIIGNRLYSFAKTKYYTVKWASNLLQKKRAKALCFDWVEPQNSVVNVLLKSANKMSIPKFALPHGVFVFTNDRITFDYKPLETFDSSDQYDCVVVQNERFLEFLTHSGLDIKKIFVLGSARYCDEWILQNKRILPRVYTSRADDSDKLKLVLMTTKLRYRVHVDQLMTTLEILSEFEGIDIVIKPHTRTGKESNFFDNVSIPLAADVSSVELCEWADAVLVIGSSIILESLIQGQPVLYLKYLHENTTIYEEYEACWIVKSEAELINALNSLKRSKNDVPYLDANVQRFISEIVFNGGVERDILGDYEALIVNFKKK